ncbi:hypothetical protein ZIOFF_001686 [Zingiber officinale]|uniref:dUTP diphosphatase n=1 Tax=Zingiber officinale TaxID=94328 RepID=A0A8J5LV81_ZINOF|nr:hypothetical protein ZIOFF_001686 [Zingiber officinale]
MQERASLVPIEVLYHSRRDDADHRVYIQMSEEAILVINNNQVDQSFIQEDSFNQLQRSRMQYIHLGILQVCIQILHRQQEGTMALIVFRYNRWQGDQAILATIEVDLTQGSQMIYAILETMLTIGDFFRNIQISILARGYEAWQNGEANLSITRGMVGRLSNTPNVGFAYKIQGLVDYLTTHGVKALPGRSLSTQRLQGLNWVIQPTQVIVPMQPSEVNSINLMDGRISLSFHNYIAAQLPACNQQDEEIQNDEQVIVLIDKENGLDLTANEDCIIPPRGRGLISTSISMEIPWGAYGRIAARSSVALKLGLDIGARVIDCDYRGEIKILVFNHSDKVIHINRGDCVAQLILEYVVISDVYEVDNLTPTAKRTQGFGLETQDQSATPYEKKPIASKERWDTLGQPKHSLSDLEQDHAGATSPGVTVLQSMETTLENSDNDFFEQIQYMASITNPLNEPIWDTYNHMDEEWLNPFATEGDGKEDPNSHLLVVGCEMEYPSLKQLLDETPTKP